MHLLDAVDNHRYTFLNLTFDLVVVELPYAHRQVCVRVDPILQNDLVVSIEVLLVVA